MEMKADTGAATARETVPLPPTGPAGRLLFRLLPLRRRVLLENLREALGKELSGEEIVRLAEAVYGHLGRCVVEGIAVRFSSPRRRAGLVRVENKEAVLSAVARGKGALILTGHLGNWEVAPILAMEQLPEYRGKFHILRRPIRARWLDRLLTRRFETAGIGVISKKGSLDRILERLEEGHVVVFVLDQHASEKDAVSVEFFGRKASTLRSLAVVALATGAPVVPAACFRDTDGRHVLRFEEALPTLEDEDTGKAIEANTRAYNAALERLIRRHPEQWLWIHRRWKAHGRRGARARRGGRGT
jgi:KDO2-lipid IV(A) lauroyltransferase